MNRACFPFTPSGSVFVKHFLLLALWEYSFLARTAALVDSWAGKRTRGLIRASADLPNSTRPSQRPQVGEGTYPPLPAFQQVSTASSRTLASQPALPFSSLHATCPEVSNQGRCVFQIGCLLELFFFLLCVCSVYMLAHSCVCSWVGVHVCACMHKET